MALMALLALSKVKVQKVQIVQGKNLYKNGAFDPCRRCTL